MWQERLNALGARLLTLLRWLVRILLWPVRALWRFLRWAPGAGWRSLRWLVRAPFRLARWLGSQCVAAAWWLFDRLLPLLRWPVDAVRQRRWRRLLVLGVALVMVVALAVGGLLFLRGRSARTAQIAPTVTALSISAPATIDAGAPLTVTIAAQPPVSGTVVILTTQGTSGLVTQAQPLRDGSTTFTLASAPGRAAGALAVTASAGPVQAHTTITVHPGRAVDPLLTVAGPRSVMAGGDEAMVVSLPLDVYGNAVNDSTLVTVETQHPPPPGKLIGPVDTFVQGTRDLLTAVRVRSREVAGPLLVAAFGDGAHSLAQTVRVQPAPPLTVTVGATPDQAPADGESMIRLATNRLTDRFGNQLLDGVLVSFLVESSDGTRRWLPATVIDGVAATLLPAPTAPVTQAVHAWVGGVLSAPITVTFRAGAAVQPFPLASDHRGDATVITAGPILGELNQLAPDDTAVFFTFARRGDVMKTLTGLTVYGYAAVTVYDGELPAGDYTVAATLGATQATLPLTLPAPADAPADAPAATPSGAAP